MSRNSITFVVTNYNKEKYVCRCIDSILNQIDRDDYIVIIDDCSSDDSEKLIRCYLKYDNIKFIKNKKNSGVSYSRNIGIDIAKTKLITFIDSDDTIADNYIKSIRKDFVNDIQCLCYGFNFIDDISKLHNQSSVISTNKSASNIDKIILLENAGLFASTCNKIYSLDYIKKNKIYFNINSKIMEDYEFNLKYFKNIEKFSILDKCFYNYYYFGDISASSKYKKDLMKRYYELRELRSDFYGKYNSSDVAIKYNIDFLKICINNLYKSNGQLTYTERIATLKEIILLNEFKIWKKSTSKGVLDKLLKLAFFTNNVRIMDFNMNVLHFIKNNSTIAHNYFKKKNKNNKKG